VAGHFPTSSTNALNQSETREFDAKTGALTKLTGPNGLATQWTLDSFGRKVLESRADGTSTTWTYAICGTCPAGGRYSITTASSGAPTTVAYFDALGREIQTETQGFDGTWVRKDSEYDAMGRVSRVSRPYYAGATKTWTSFTYDILGRTLTRTDPNNAVTSTTYNGFTTTITNALNQTETRVKNSQGQLVEVVRQ
jgi:YD repeat-containing protein